MTGPIPKPHLLDVQWQTNQRRLDELRGATQREMYVAEIEHLEAEQAQIEFECSEIGVDGRSIFRDRPRRL